MYLINYFALCICFKVEKFKIDWDRILTYDKPFGCAQLLICQIEAGISFPIEKDNEDVIIISYLVQ